MSIKVGEYVGLKVWQNVDKYAWDANDDKVYMFDPINIAIRTVKENSYRALDRIIYPVYNSVINNVNQ